MTPERLLNFAEEISRHGGPLATSRATLLNQCALILSDLNGRLEAMPREIRGGANIERAHVVQAREAHILTCVVIIEFWLQDFAALKSC